MNYGIVVHFDSATNSYWTEVPALPGCFSAGDTEAEAVASTREAIELYLKVLIEENQPIPLETQP